MREFTPAARPPREPWWIAAGLCAAAIGGVLAIVSALGWPQMLGVGVAFGIPAGCHVRGRALPLIGALLCGLGSLGVWLAWRTAPPGVFADWTFRGLAIVLAIMGMTVIAGTTLGALIGNSAGFVVRRRAALRGRAAAG